MVQNLAYTRIGEVILRRSIARQIIQTIPTTKNDTSILPTSLSIPKTDDCKFSSVFMGDSQLQFPACRASASNKLLEKVFAESFAFMVTLNSVSIHVSNSYPNCPRIQIENHPKEARRLSRVSELNINANKVVGIHRIMLAMIIFMGKVQVTYKTEISGDNEIPTIYSSNAGIVVKPARKAQTIAHFPRRYWDGAIGRE